MIVKIHSSVLSETGPNQGLTDVTTDNVVVVTKSFLTDPRIQLADPSIDQRASIKRPNRSEFFEENNELCNQTHLQVDKCNIILWCKLNPYIGNTLTLDN